MLEPRNMERGEVEHSKREREREMLTGTRQLRQRSEFKGWVGGAEE